MVRILPVSLRFYHFLCLCVGLCHRLFTHNVLAGFHCCNADRCMCVIGSQNVDNVHILFHQLCIIGINSCVGCAVFFFCFLRPLFDQVTKCNQLDLSVFLDCGKMLSVCNSAAAYYACFNNFVMSDSFPSSFK